MKRKSAKSGNASGTAKLKNLPALRPEGMSLQQWQLALRCQAAAKGLFTVSELSDRWSPGQYTVSSPQSRRTYRVAFHGDGSDRNYCECFDFRTNNLGVCKHIEAVRMWLEERGKKPVTSLPKRSSLEMSYKGGRHLRLRLGPNAPEGLAMAAMRYFDDDFTAVAGMVADLPDFIEQARKLEPQFHCYPDALNFILEERDRRRRHALSATIKDSDIAAVLKTKLYPYQIEGIRFAFDAGRVLIADEMGLGKTVQAIGTAELMKEQNMVSSVLIVCPTSLKYQWKKEIERFTGSTVTVIEGAHTHRRDLYLDASFYKIVSYHTLANDIKVLGTLSFDLLVMDEVQRLKNWNTQIAQAARRIEADYCVVLSGTPLENKLEELYSVMQFVDQYALGPYYEFVDRHIITSPSGKVTGYRDLNEIGNILKPYMLRRRRRDVALQLPERSDKVLFVPMTKEQRQIHDECQSAVAQLVFRWQRNRFLSEKDRKRLLLLISRMRMVCDSTFIIDQKTRFDTKIGEALQLIQALTESGDEKAVVFSQWERMTRIFAEELDKAGIGYEYLHGGVPSSKRGELTENFRNDPAKRVFISTDAGSSGLNLQSASVVINLDLPWNPAVLEQRIARVYRIGQRRNIQVINMVAAGTVEERMLATLNFKSNLFAGILDGGEDQITLDDSKLNRIAESISEIIPDNLPSQSAMVADEEPEDKPEETDGATSPQRTTPQTDELLSKGADFISCLADTLRSPRATADLIDSLVHTDPDTGRAELRIPVESRQAVADIVGAFAKFFIK